MANIRILESTGSHEEDAKLLAEVKGDLINATSFEEAKERERVANLATATEPSRNALTEEPRIKGQVLAVMLEADEVEAIKNSDNKKSIAAISEEKQLKTKTIEVPTNTVLTEQDKPVVTVNK